MKNIFWILLFWMGCQATSQGQIGDGQVFAIEVSISGVHQITHEQLRQVGIDTRTTPSETLQLFGFGGGMLPQANSSPRPERLPEVALHVQPRSDGGFDLWFYAEGPDAITWERETERLRYEKNLFAEKNYYFLKVSDAINPRRIQTVALSQDEATPITQFNDLLHYENDQYNLLASIRRAPGGSGRDWLGEVFDFQTVYDFPFDLSGHIDGTPIRITSRVVGYAFGNTHYEVTANGVSVGRQDITPSVESTYARKGYADQSTFTFNGSAGKDFSLRLSYQKGNTTAVGFLDFLQINFVRKLQCYADQTHFRSFFSTTQAVSRFIVENPTGTPVQVWEITQPQQVTQIPIPDPTAAQISFALPTLNRLRTFVAFRTDRVPPVERIQKIDNQDLRSLATPNLLIITPDVFLAQAERLADFRRNNDGLSVAVLRLDQIYREFSSGRPDVTALRDAIRHFYRKNPTQLRYVLLFGDASYDPKNRTAGNTNFVPIYQSRESFHPIFSYGSDDYFAFMEANEGEWAEDATGNHTLDLGVGRLPVRTLLQAQQVVDKLIAYQTHPNRFGSWRNRILFVADDGDRNIHQDDSERLAQQIEHSHPAYRVERLYVDAFEQIPDENGRKRAPAARQALNAAVNSGTFIVNFMGHGSEAGWTSENILDAASIQRWRNPDQMPLFVTATCEFGRYDNPERESGGERIILSPTGGGVALITTTRPVFSNTNFLAARAFYENVFEDPHRRLGDIMRRTKNNSLTLVNRNFALLGDPSMRLATPLQQVVMEGLPDSLRALERITLRGSIQNNGQPNPNFSGTAQIRIFDAREPIRTLGEESDPAEYPEHQHLLLQGSATVTDGRFQLDWIVPVDVSTRTDRGRIEVYAFDNQEQDAHGGQYIPLGGRVEASHDQNPPEVQAWLGDRDFVEGMRVPQQTILLVEARDESGFNPSAKDRQMIAFLDDDLEQSWVLNPYFETATDDFTKGFIHFPLQNLSLGPHTLTVRLWDAHNNMSETTIAFVVIAEGLALRGETVYPNPLPFGERVTFNFSHNRSGDDLALRLEIIDPLGRIVFVQEETVFNAPERIDVLSWQSPFPQSRMYLYRITVRTQSGETGSGVGKIITLP